jgi:HK97 gp10 family phage protein
MDEFNHFGEIAEKLPTLMGQVTSRTADKGVQNIQNQIQANGQVRTGRMLNSVHVEDGEDGDKTIVVGVPYAAYPNYGTRYQPAKPFFEPGLERTKQDLEDALDAAAGEML